jgi:pimeloyl-ACP methyl ester carboxylesterase
MKMQRERLSRKAWHGAAKFAVLAFMGLGAVPAAHAAATIATEEFMVPTGDPGISVYVRNKHPAGMKKFSQDKILLYVHGTSQPGEATFDLPLDGLSWMDYIAKDGWDVYFVDIRGFGHSSKPPEMSQPADANPPVATTDVAVKDAGAAVDFIEKRRHVSKINLMGWSWGTAITGSYTAQHNDKVNRLVLYSPVWVFPQDPAASEKKVSPDGADRAAGFTANAAAADVKPLGAYWSWTVEQARTSLEYGAPKDVADSLMPPEWFAAWKAAALATDPEGAKQNPPVVRTPSGPPADSLKYWKAGKALYDPSQIAVPTLVIHGEWDGLLTTTMSHAYFDKLSKAPYRRFVDIGGATHLMLLERNRMQLYHEVQAFLNEKNATRAEK